MIGEIKRFLTSKANMEYGFIAGDDGRDYYFDDRSLVRELSMDDLVEGDEVTFDTRYDNQRQRYYAMQMDFSPAYKKYLKEEEAKKKQEEAAAKAEAEDNLVAFQPVMPIEKEEPQAEEKAPEAADEMPVEVNEQISAPQESSPEELPEKVEAPAVVPEPPKAVPPVKRPTSSELRFFRNGYATRIDAVRMDSDHLKAGSGEHEVLDALAKLLYVSYVGHHDMGHGSRYPFALLGATEHFRQYIKGNYEFLMVFSHFDNQQWQQNTIQAIKHIRKRNEVNIRRPLVNFVVLISNAYNLQAEIDKMTGSTEAAIIPFTFEEILSYVDWRGKVDTDGLLQCMLSRFDEYLYENNMLGEENPIEEDALLFGDRGKIADAILQRSIEGKHSGVFGLRRSGKSSVLRAVQRRLEANDICYALIESRSELENIDSWKTALYDIARKIRISTSRLEQDPDETRREFNQRLRLNSEERDYWSRPTQSFVEDVKLYTRSTGRFVLMIDEVELITYNTANSEMWQDLDAYKGFWGALRDSGCALVICGVNSTVNERSIIEFKGQTCDNPMYERIQICSGFSKTYLPAFTDEQTRVMINTLGSFSNIAFSEVYVDINRAFGGQPYAIRQFCSYAFEQVKKYRSPGRIYELSKASFNGLLMRFNQSEKGVQLSKTILQHVAIYRDEYNMLIRMAQSPEKFSNLRHEDISLVDHLEKYGLIEYDRQTMFVSFCVESVRKYLQDTAQKRPEDMTNDERRRYVHDSVRTVEQKLKKYILDYYLILGITNQGRSVLLSNGIRPKNNVFPAPNPQTCGFAELFDHNQFIFYFSAIKNIIYYNWSQLGMAFENNGVSRDKFKVCLEDMNAGRTDADHYDPENSDAPTDWEISDSTLQSFASAANTISDVLKKMGR